MKTRITELFGIEYPIVQGAMQWLSKPNLAAAVSNAGGLGTINMTTYADPEDFQKDIQRLKRLTDKPFSVNLSLLPDTKPDGPIKGFLQAIVDEKVRIVETAGSSPKPFMDLLKGAGCVVMHKIPDSRFAHTAEEVGCDAVCIVAPDPGALQLAGRGRRRRVRWADDVCRPGHGAGRRHGRHPLPHGRGDGDRPPSAPGRY